MAHLLLIRQSRSFVVGENLIYGTHQQIEQEIDKRKYEINKVRNGYCIPTSCEWNLLDYRIKEDVLPDFVKDIHGYNLNPYPNNITIKSIITSKLPDNVKNSVGRTFIIIQWLFKWINKKKTTSVLLFILGILTLQLWLLILIPIIIINPIKPCPIASQKEHNPFTDDWHKNFIIGIIKDTSETDYKGEVQTDVL